ncbi:hypothetical protein [Sulfuriroseicoccus oceanibius]|uniref:DUF4878 domain-containing protein n=1 Tax=Sulfuriroseicoccus oceanibius TaxID=2707525 RepID=A0A6B3LAC9_9BACT|nr:hypothetical protein [Sulfuriroseicoccus oceanibius]QQL46172.1 hypothetical protein G3M56_006215 [Sulfuriroseicoccus oceanibius]
MKSFLKIAALSLLALASSLAETPQEGLAKITEYYKNSNFKQLITERYSEIHKAKTDEEVAKFVAKFEKRFADPKRLEKVVAQFEMIAGYEVTIEEDETPQPTETGKVAKFTKPGEEGRSFKLYEMKNGLWGFHL